MKTILATAALLLCITFFVPAQGQISSSQGGHLFRVKYKPNSTLKYLMKADSKLPPQMSSNSSPGSLAVQMPLILKIGAVNKGIANAEVTIGPTAINGKTQGQAQTQAVQLDSRGRDTSTGEALGFGLLFPEKPVKPGATWTATTKGMFGPSAQMELRATYKFIGIKNVKGARVAEVGMSAVSGDAKSPMKTNTNGSIFLLAQDGSIHSAKLNQVIEFAMSAGAQPIEAKTAILIARQ